MRQLPLPFLLIPMLLSGPPTWAADGTARTPGETAARAAPGGSTDTSWSEGLKVGVNGPIPVIVVDQFGYPTVATKVAVIRDPQAGYDGTAHFTPGRIFAVVAKATGKTVKKGPPFPWNGGATDDVSGDKAWWFDFSDVKQPGTYTIVDTEKGVRSVEFEIDDGVYRNVLKHAVRMFYYQRAGFKKTAETAGSDWADSASHLGMGQDSQSRPWQGKRESAVRGAISGLIKGDAVQVKDLRGGWFDAGDYNKYSNWTARVIIALLRAYSENPAAFGDDTGIAESGNGVPDILDEIKWGLDWLVRMQNMDGSVLCVQGLDDRASPPSAAAGPSYYGPPTTAASLMGAAAFAYASKIYSTRPEADLKSYGDELATRAKSAWDWAAAHPGVVYFNNDNAKQPGSAGLASGQQEMTDADRQLAKFEAAVYLFELTGEAGYRDFVESNYAAIIAPWGPNQWDANRQEALIYYARLPGASVDASFAIMKKFVTNVTGNPDQLPMIINNKDPYRAPIKDYTWASNMSKMFQARLYQLLALYGASPAATAKIESVALEYLHYIHGVNPLGYVYLTNMKSAGAEQSASTMFHSWFSSRSPRWSRVTDATPGPPPGYLVGGPNPSFALDACCTAADHCRGAATASLCSVNYAPPLGQPALKSYRDFNDDWPANSWAVTEPSTTYQAQYIRVLARYVH
jgi:endoglucanase